MPRPSAFRLPIVDEVAGKRDYSTADPQAYHELIPLPSPSLSARVTTLGAFAPYTQTNVIPLSSQQCNSGANLATDLQFVIRSVHANATF